MKYLELDQETENQLATILDIALKHSGISALPLVDALRNKIKQKEERNEKTGV